MAATDNNARAAKKGSDRSKMLGMEAEKEKNFADWYTQVITKSEMIEYYDVSGCYILRPWSFSIWEEIQHFFDSEIKKLGVQNSYFPLFVSERALNAEKDHVEGFAPEVAWVTRSGKSALKEPIAIRPTSETIMYPAYSKWIRSHRDLPLKLNQWANVVRWEFKNPTPFLRSREFLWQEGHTVFSTLQEAGEEVLQILDLYARVYEELLAVPVIKGTKSENEKFPGGHYTTTIEAFVPSTGRAIQAATSHCLGQNFAKMFDIQFEDDKGEKQYAWQNSWGLTTRSIGITVMVHGDNKGLVLPPRVAPVQVVVIPILYKDKDNAVIVTKGKEISKLLSAQGFRTHLDDREGYNPGWKYNHWELKGVPIRLEFGPKDMENNTVVLARRDGATPKEVVSIDKLVERVGEVLSDVHRLLFERATQVRNERISRIARWEEFVPALEARNMVLTPWCEQKECEETVKDKTGPQKKDKVAEEAKKKEAEAAEEEFIPLTSAAKTLCLPHNPDLQTPIAEGTPCFHCGAKATKWCLWGRSY
jgi:prolyl-tRNA synthetase